MTEKQIVVNGKLKNATIAVREDHTLAMKVLLPEGSRTLVFHDYLTAGKKRFHLFHEKTDVRITENGAVIRTPAVSAEDGAPIMGLIVVYRVTFDTERAAFYLSAEYTGDRRIADYNVRLMDVTWEDMTPVTFTGYEHDALGRPLAESFEVPPQEPDHMDYETKLSTYGPVMFEKMKVAPHGFRTAVSIEDEVGSLTVYGGKPIYDVEGEFITVFPEISQLGSDLRYYSGANAPGAWFIFEKQPDMFALFEELAARTPKLPVSRLTGVTRTLTLTSGRLTASLALTKGGVWSVADGAQAAPLFHISLWDTKYKRGLKTDSGCCWDVVDVTERKNYLRVALSDPENGRVNGVTVICEAFCEPKLDRISWKTTLVNRSERWSVSNLSYPQGVVRGFDTAVINDGSGVLIKEFTRTASAFHAAYPRGTKTPMAFVALYNQAGEGIYHGIHDAEGSPKFIGVAGAAQCESALLTAQFTLPWQHRAGNSCTLPGMLVWQRFDGDWFDATNIYREFVHTQASWFPKLRGRSDSPEWIRTMPVWIMHFLPNENPDANPVPITLRERYPDKTEDEWYTKAIRFTEEIGVPTAYHVYNWHWVPFNNDNPHYFPARPDFKEGVEKLHAAGIRVMPYIAGYSWDKHDRRGDDYRFENEAAPNTARDLAGNVIVNSHASTEPNGLGVEFARMCPSTAFWKDEMRHVCRTLAEEYGVDGIYLDVVSASYNMCCDESHMHEPGFGSWWWRAYDELIAGIRAATPDEFAITSESVSEVYASALDAYLAWTWVQPDQVPAFPTVYGGRVGLFGRVITPNKRDDDAFFRHQAADALMYGEQLGWIHPEVVSDDKQFPFFKKMAGLRWHFAEFFTSAEMLRPATVDGKMAMLNMSPFLRGKYRVHEKAVLSSAWEDADGHRVLFCVNSADEPAEVTLTFRQSEYALPADVAFSLCDGATLLGDEQDGDRRTLRIALAPQSYGVIEWKK